MTAQHWTLAAVVALPAALRTILEGYADLIYRETDGSLAIVDYKTDAIPAGTIQSRVDFYAPQMAAYRQALSAATGAVVSTTLLFLNPTTSTAVKG